MMVHMSGVCVTTWGGELPARLSRVIYPRRHGAPHFVQDRLQTGRRALDYGTGALCWTLVK